MSANRDERQFDKPFIFDIFATPTNTWVLEPERILLGRFSSQTRTNNFWKINIPKDQVYTDVNQSGPNNRLVGLKLARKSRGASRAR